jgi:ParB family transcriptional regulator, chromosome partitioning protein
MASKKAALGKGLGALLPSGPGQDETRGEPEAGAYPTTRLYNLDERVRLLGRVADLDVDAIRPNPYQPRLHFDEGALEELAESIRQLGIIQPITVRALGNGRFEVISGERRLRASRLAGLPRIPAYVREADTEAMLEMAIVENVQREDLNPIEVALGYQRLMEECRLTQEQVAERVGKNRTTVTNHLRLLRLPPSIQASIREGTVTTGHAKMLVAVEDEAAQQKMHLEILSRGLSVRDVERLVRDFHRREEARLQPDLFESPKNEPPRRDDLEIERVAAQIRTQLSTNVQIKHKSDGSGRIEIAYYSLDDLERVLELLLGR